MAEWPGKGLQNPLPGFDSRRRLVGIQCPQRALSSAAERCLDTAEVGGSIPPAPTLETLALQGFQLFLWEVDDLVLVQSRQKVGSRCVGGCIEGIRDVAVEAFEEVSVDVEDGPHRRVPEP